MHRLFRRRDPRDHRFGETVHPRPGAVADAMLVGGHVHYGAASLGGGHRVVALLVGEDNQAVALAVDLRHRLAEPGPAVRLRTHDRIAQRKAAAGRDRFGRRRYPNFVTMNCFRRYDDKEVNSMAVKVRLAGQLIGDKLAGAGEIAQHGLYSPTPA